ncbi:MAG TPA: PfkB family carbohydrate kinase [Ktedonobacteraceae bacterium]|jgi:sugar/nucleoside kinase (ribokinase family)
MLVNLSASHLAEKIALLALLPSIDVIQVSSRGSLQEACLWGQRMLGQCPARALVITLGSAGAVLVERHATCIVAAQPLRPLRTIGAGASFSAGFLSALLAGSTYQEATRFASRHAAAFCTAAGNPLEVKEQ